MLGEIQYGGRVTDNFDQRLLNTYCQSWFHEGLFSPDFLFATGFPVPQFAKLSEILDWINELPNADSPKIFGLHENANISLVIWKYCHLFNVKKLSVVALHSSLKTYFFRLSYSQKCSHEMLFVCGFVQLFHPCKLEKLGNGSQ